jgi:hypothetical protein
MGWVPLISLDVLLFDVIMDRKIQQMSKKDTVIREKVRNLLLKPSNNTSIYILCSKMYLWLMKLMVDNAKPNPHASPLAIFHIEINFPYGGALRQIVLFL